jgi:hypothetical protein
VRAQAISMDKTGQVWLPGVPSSESVRVADVCLRQLCQSFIEQCPTDSEARLSSELDDLSLACLLLAVEWGKRSPEETSAPLASCLDAVADRFWGDLLPWKLALEFCRHNPRGVYGLPQLMANLDHHNSSIRGWMLDLGWIVRHKLYNVDVMPKLLKNVADTLAYWDLSLGLCRALFPDDEAFFKAADNFQPESLADQYQERLALARERGLPLFQLYFKNMELGIRQKICGLALGLTPEEIQIVEQSSGR